jgi:Polyketide cyclase / dehydrase and lipid transport
VIRVSEGGVLPVSVPEGCRYITDPANWPEYWPGATAVEAPGWSRPGDEATVTMKLLGRQVELRLVLEELVPGELVRYSSTQRGLPDAHHERRFADAEGRLLYTLVTEYEPRGVLWGLYDRTIVPRAVRRAMRTTLRRLTEIFAGGATPPGG